MNFYYTIRDICARLENCPGVSVALDASSTRFVYLDFGGLRHQSYFTTREVTGDWNIVCFTDGLSSGEQMLAVLRPLAIEHADAVVAVSQPERLQLFLLDDPIPTMQLHPNHHNFYETLLNPYRRLEESVIHLNAENVHLEQAVDYFDQPATLYLIGERWYSKTGIDSDYPKLRCQKDWALLFERVEVGTIVVFRCIADEKAMRLFSDMSAVRFVLDHKK